MASEGFLPRFWAWLCFVWRVLWLLLSCQTPGLRVATCLQQEERPGCHRAGLPFPNASSVRTGALSGVFAQTSSPLGLLLLFLHHRGGD